MSACTKIVLALIPFVRAADFTVNVDTSKSTHIVDPLFMGAQLAVMLPHARLQRVSSVFCLHAIMVARGLVLLTSLVFMACRLPLGQRVRAHRAQLLRTDDLRRELRIWQSIKLALHLPALVRYVTFDRVSSSPA